MWISTFHSRVLLKIQKIVRSEDCRVQNVREDCSRCGLQVLDLQRALHADVSSVRGGAYTNTDTLSLRDVTAKVCLILQLPLSFIQS